MTFGEREGLVHALTMADGALGGRNIRVEVAKARPGDRAGGRRGEWIFSVRMVPGEGRDDSGVG